MRYITNDELIDGPFKSIWNAMDGYRSDTKTYLRLTNIKKISTTRCYQDFISITNIQNERIY